MIKKLTIYALLLSMALHCACRLGVLDYLYQQRHQIAYTIGLISEVPITMCSHEYNPDSSLKVEAQQDESTLPSGLFQAQEIKLFFNIPQLTINPVYQLLVKSTWRDFLIKEYPSPHTSIFHPPSLIS